ncbi:MAG: efflux RND transporter permease subunit [Desulfovibrionaceae bacterium]
MDFIKFAIQNPVSVIVGVILILMFGAIGLTTLPYQLSPTVTNPEISVTTTWTGATPYEMEREVVEEQEKVLKGIPSLLDMESTSRNGQCEITLKFAVGTNIDNALLRVSNKLNEVPSYPDNTDRPVISATGSAASPVIWMMLKTLPGNDKDINTYRTFFEDEVRQYMERVPGAADLFVFGGTEHEMHVIVDPDKLAAHGLTMQQIIDVLQSENANVSAGTMGLGRRDYRIRTVGEYNAPEDIAGVVIESTGQRRTTIGDVARVEFGYAKYTVAMLHNGAPGIVCGIQPEVGTNILDLTNAMEQVVQGLNDGKLKEQGVFLDWAYDQRPYINGAIDLVKQNIMIGGVLAIIVLLVFLQSVSSTIIVAIAIPISVVGTFIFMSLFGRNLNVVSLAGISFAVGMLVDNAIVVLENIDRHRRMGKSPYASSYDGASEVWGAVIASTATTVAVFLPVVFIQEEAGQLFKDIAIAVTCAIMLSLFVSVLVIPMFARQLFTLSRRNKQGIRGIPLITSIGGLASRTFMGVVELTIANAFSRIVTVVVLTGVAALATWAFFPKMEYLPEGNRNMVLNILVPPPGLSFDERMDIGRGVMKVTEPLMDKDEVDGLPGLKQVFYVGADRIMLFGAVSTQEQRAGELVPFFFKYMNSIPGMFGVSLQAGIFENRLGAGRNIDVDLSAGNMQQLVGGAGAMFGALMQAIPGAQIRPLPSLELLFPEVRLIPERDRIKAAGLTSTELGVILDVLMDGRKIDEFKQEGMKKIDLVVKGAETDMDTPEKIYGAKVYTNQGSAVPVSSLARLVRTTGINEIRHLERQRTITLQVTPPKNVALETAMDIIRDKVVPQLKGGPLAGITVSLAGAADKLSVTRDALQWNFLLAVVITYLLMAALFGNFIYPLIILFTVPLAGAGGFIGLKLENLLIAPQPMDVLTMLGFIILVGVVVNNAILIVHQSLNNIRIGGMAHKEAVLESVRTRLRPIYMSATTSVFGMLPLAVAPGPGSELYRGLGSVVLGGLAISTIFTVFMIPALLMFFIGMEKPGHRPQDDAITDGADQEPSQIPGV